MNTIYSHPGKSQMQVEVILASAPVDSDYHKPIYTIRMRYPRPIHGEIMTHRVFGRNARSSRAVPVKTMLNEVKHIPYVPWHWGKNQKGMQADKECSVYVQNWNRNTDLQPLTLSREEAWLTARDAAVKAAEAFMVAGYHKQNPNRLLEPFSWIDTLITSTDWENFLWLRNHKDAEPHLQDLARMVKIAISEVQIQDLYPDDWHMPYITEEDQIAANTDAKPDGMTSEDFWLQVSAARCARISYKPFDGDASYKKELSRYNQLVKSDRVHASPLEHQAKPDEYIKGHVGPYGEWIKDHWRMKNLHGNLNGYIQFRKTIPNECYHG